MFIDTLLLWQSNVKFGWTVSLNGKKLGQLPLYEIPLIWRGVSLEHPMVFEEGMTMAVETQDRDGSQGVRVEEMIVVRKGGVELLSKWPVWEIMEIL